MLHINVARDVLSVELHKCHMTSMLWVIKHSEEQFDLFDKPLQAFAESVNRTETISFHLFLHIFNKMMTTLAQHGYVVSDVLSFKTWENESGFVVDFSELRQPEEASK